MMFQLDSAIAEFPFLDVMSSLLCAAYNAGRSLVRVLIWYVLAATALYLATIAIHGKTSGHRFRFALNLNDPGNIRTFMGGLRYLFPRAIYTHPSFRIDLAWFPINVALRLTGIFGIVLGAATVQRWLTANVGTLWVMPIPDGLFAVAAQVLIMLLARDFARFVWHYQSHTVAFFWEFHKVHHSAEVLHPFGVRTHPFDLFIRNTYIGVGGGLIAGTLIYVLGMEYSSPTTIAFFYAVGIWKLVEHLEHSHVCFSFGGMLGKIFYSPYLHLFHHSAAPEHRCVNLGLAGGLTLWDRLFGTLYIPQDGEHLVWGASSEELGEHNPHRTLWQLFWTPFVAAFRTLRPHP